MCFHSKQSKDAQALEKRFHAKVAPELVVTSDHYNGFAHPQTPVITNKDPEIIQLYHWGLIPFWAKEKKYNANNLNARIETITEKVSFKSSLKNRCLILCDGFMEWQWLDEKGKKKQPYLITLPHDEVFAFAGLYSNWIDKSTGEIINTYTIVTTEANDLMAEIHNIKKRMPIILTPENEKKWLNEENLLDFQYPEIELIATAI